MLKHTVHIALPLPTPRLFSYTLPTTMLPVGGSAQVVGARVLVPFGKRVLTGVVVEFESENTPHTPQAIHDIKDVLEVLDSSPVFTPTMLSFAHWIAEYYMASLGETLRAMLPQGMSPESVVRVSTLRRPSEEELQHMEHRAPRRARLLRELLRHDNDVSVGYLEKMMDAGKASSGSISAQLEALEHEGIIERKRVVQDAIKPKTLKAVELSADMHDERLRAVMDELDAQSPKQALLLSTIYLHYARIRQADEAVPPLFAKDALKGLSESVLKSLVQKGYVREFQAEALRTHEAAPPHIASVLVSKDESDVRLTVEQEHAIEKICEPLETGVFKTFLLHGVTGSGKTLVYFQIIRRALSMGKTALMLVPEISLTPQLIERFRAVFGNRIGVMHSHKSAGERYDAWRMAKQGQIDIIIGARSAIFTPLPNVGVIIVDEEHEPSYKQDSPAPRYNARDCAIVRGTFDRAVVVLGSATPSLESMFNARSGKYHLLEITSRADGAQMPTIHVVDVAESRKRRQMHGAFSESLLQALLERVKKREGVILFQNRRGFASRLECLECGTIPMCPNCSVALTYHKHRDQLRCHYCGHSHAAEKSCSKCGSPAMKEIGMGTQRIEDELHTELKMLVESRLQPEDRREIVVQRMDLDTTAKKGAHAQMLARFAKGEVDILLGTQMVAKGLDFARVTLVGVINADMQMYLPDFRAAERTFQLLTQVSGRAGRSSDFRGEVIIQTSHPRHQTILAATTASYELFYNDELQFRKEAAYPPFTRFAMIEFSGLSEQLVHEQAQYFAFYLPRNNKAFALLGPTVPSIARLRSQYRRIIVLKNFRDIDPAGKQMRSAILHAYSVYNSKHPSSAVHITIDIDATGFV